MSAKHYGVTVNLYLDGQGYESGVTMSCDNNGEFDHKCPFALHETMPMESGDVCARRSCGECYVVAAKLDALEKAERMLKAEIKKTKDMMEV